MFVRVGVGEHLQLLEQERVFQDALDGFDQVRLQRGRVLLARVPRLQKVAQDLVRLCKANMGEVESTQMKFNGPEKVDESKFFFFGIHR